MRIKEEVPVTPTNNVGDGNIAGLGIGKQGEPGVDLKKKRKVMPFNAFLKRKELTEK